MAASISPAGLAGIISYITARTGNVMLNYEIEDVEAALNHAISRAVEISTPVPAPGYTLSPSVDKEAALKAYFAAAEDNLVPWCFFANIKDGNKVEAIEEFRHATGLSLKEAKGVVDAVTSYVSCW